MRYIGENADIPILYLNGEIDVVCAPDLKNNILRLLNDGQTNLYIDLSNVTYIDSSGLGILIMSVRHAAPQGGKVVLIGVKTQVKQIFELTRLDRYFDFPENEQAFLTSLASPSDKNSSTLPL